MRFPIILCRRNTLVPAGRDFFQGNYGLDESSNRIDCAIGADGFAYLAWILDADGRFFRCRSEGVMSHKILQRLRLVRRQERFHIEAPISVTVGELFSLVSRLHDPKPELPNVRDLLKLLRKNPAETVVDREIMRMYMGE